MPVTTKHSFDLLDDRFVELARPALGLLYERYFRVGFHGAAGVPPGPVLFVGNHNGMLGFEIPMLLEGWLRQADKIPASRRRILGLAHSYAIEHPLFKPWLPKLGAIPARHDLALEALEKGYSVLVYPGGDLEAARPWRDRAKVIFSGRTGYARLALEAGVPIVPVVNVGAHEQQIILARLDGLAQRLGLVDTYRFHGVPVTLRGLPFLAGLLFKPTRHLSFLSIFAASAFPLPTKMDYFFLDAVKLSEDELRVMDADEQVAELDARVRGALQARLSEEYSKRRFPVFG